MLDSIFTVMFAASLQREEQQSILFHVVYLDPENPDPEPPRRIRENRWTFVPLAMPLPLSIANLVKLAQATDPRTSSIVVFPDATAELQIWGLVDQGTRHFEYRRYGTPDGAWARPGLFQASVLGVGQLDVQTEWNTVAGLKGLDLLDIPVDALRVGPLRDALSPGLDRLLAQTRRSVVREVGGYDDEYDRTVSDLWLGTICSLLLRVQSHRHGGAVLVATDASRSRPSGLNPKYRIDYRRIETSLISKCAHLLAAHEYDDRLSILIDADVASLPVGSYLDAAVTENRERDANDSVDGALWFVSLLSRVDGLVLVTPNLRVTGFGVEITIDKPPALVRRAGDANATDTQPLSYNHFGTRHRSMMRYCFKHSGSVGFVVSQDGEIRAMTRAGEALLFWENVQLRRY